MDKNTVTSRVYAGYGSGQYARVLDEIEQLPAEQRETGELSYIKLCMLSLVGRVEEALEFLKELAGKRIWLDPAMLQEDRDLISLRGTAEFPRLCATHEALKSAASAETNGTLIVSPEGAGPYPLLLVLHGNQQNAAETLPRWSKAAEDGWMVAALQSQQSGYGSGSYVWNDYSATRAQVLEFLNHHRDRWNGTVVLGGFSRGARTAISLALDGTVPTAGVLAVCPASLEEVPSWTVNIASGPIRATVFLGAEDPYTRQSDELERCLTLTGSEVTYRVIDGMEHAYPEDFPIRIARMMHKIPKN
jgi:dienelactone hydrolase